MTIIQTKSNLLLLGLFFCLVFCMVGSATASPLISNFTASPTSGVEPLAVRFTDTSTGSPTQWDWYFGDGSANSTEQNPVHNYTAAGAYTVTLHIVNGSEFSTTTKSSYITVNPAPQPVTVQFNATPTSGVAPLTVYFNDYSTGFPEFWCWTFGDNSPISNDLNPVHRYSTAGSYTVRLQEWKNSTLFFTEKPNYITVIPEQAPLIAQFNATPTSGSAPLTVQFNDYSTGSPEFWCWTFGDNSPISNDLNPVHTYTTPGSYTVGLQEWKNSTLYFTEKSNYIIVTSEQQRPLFADFTSSQTSGIAPLTVFFNDTSTGFPNSWSWSFGDGNFSVLQNPVHTYTSTGTYSVSLQITNASSSNTTTKGNYITVTSGTQSGPLALVSSTFYGGGGDQTGTGIAMNGNTIYVTGDYPLVNWPSSTALVLKYTQDLSSPVWSRTFGSGTYFYSVATTPDGVLAAGANYGLTHDHIGDKETKTFLADFRSNGTSGSGPGDSLWVTGGFGDLGTFVPSYDGGELFSAVTTTVENDSADVYATGSVEPYGWRFVHAIAKYDASGNFTRVSIEPDTSYSSAGNGITILNGYIYTAGFAGERPVIWKYNKDLNQIWKKRDLSLGGWYNGVTASGTAIYAVGNTYTSGATNSEDFLIDKYDQDGNLLWRNTSGGTNTDVLTGVINVGNHLFAVGYTKSQGSGGADAVILEIDPDTGYTLSTTLFGGAQDDKANGVATDGTDLYVVGESKSFASATGNALGQDDIMLLRYSLPEALPIASFTATPTSGNVPLTVQFTDTSTGFPTSWNWSFGDGIYSTEESPSHIYTNDGSYSVTLTTSNVNGTNSKTKTDYITVTSEQQPLFADFIASPTTGTAPLPVSFTDLSLNSPTGWAWFFGDENYSQPWTQVNTSAGWSARSSHSSVVMPDGSIVLMGGQDGAPKNDVWLSTDNGATWTQMNASAGWSARWGQGSVAMPDGSIVLTGGYDTSAWKNDVWRSRDNGATWTEVNASAGWSGRGHHSSVVMPDGRIVLMGGVDMTGGSYHFKNDVWQSTDNGVTWTQVNTSAGWSARYGHSSVVAPDGSIVLIGGYNGGSYYQDVWRSTDNGATWIEVNLSPGWSGRSGHSSVVMPDGSIVLIGGYAPSVVNDVWRSTDNGASWIQVSASAEWSARTAHTSVAMPDGSIVLMGGYDGNNRNDVWRLMPAGSSARNPSHTYTTSGIYPVALQVYNASGYTSTRKTGYITVMGGTAPVKQVNIPYSENYDSLVPGIFPTGYIQYYSGRGWEYAAVDNSQSVSSSNSFKMEGAESWSQEVGVPLNGTLRDILTAEVMVKTDRAPGDGREGFWTDHKAGLAEVGFLKASPRENFGFAWFSYDPATHAYEISTGNETVTLAQNFTPNTWYKVRIQTNLVSRTFTVWIDDTPLATNVLYSALDTPEILLLNADNGGSFTKVWYDDVTITTSPFAGSMFRANPQHTGVYDSLVNPTNHEKWHFTTGGSIGSSPCIADGMLYFGSNDNKLYAVSEITGVEKWNFTTGGIIYASPAIADGIVYFGSYDNNIYAVYADNGTEKWHFSTGGQAGVSSPLIDEGIVYIGSRDGKLYALDANTGAQRWNFRTADFVESSPAIADGIVYFGSNDNKFYAVFANNGTERWHITTGGFVAGSPAISDGIIYIGGGDTKLYALHAENGVEKWNFTASNIIYTSPAIRDNVVYIGSEDYNLYAINTSDGIEKWRFTTGDQIYTSSAAIVKDIVYVGSYDNKVYALDINTGTERWNFTTGGDIYASPVISDGVLFIGSMDGKMYALGGEAPQQPIPIANFAANVTMGPAPFSVQFTDLSSNSPTGWAWYFGDENYSAPWTQMTANAGWGARADHTSLAMPDGSIVSIGGINGGAITSDVWRSTDDGATWKQVTASTEWSPRIGDSIVVMPDGSIVMMGGYNGSDKNDVWRSTDNGATWKKMTASAEWSPREYMASVVMPDGNIVLMGGSYQNGYLNDVWRSTDEGATWTQMTANAEWVQRNIQNSVAMPDGSIVMMGGTSNYNPTALTDVWRSTDEGATWTQVNASAGWTPKEYMAIVKMPDGSILVIGGIGTSGNCFNDVWRSTDEGATWTQVTANAEWQARYALSVVAMPDGNIVVMGGWDNSGNRNDVWRLVPTGSSVKNPLHTYITPGIYHVALQAYNNGGYNSTRKTEYITVTGSSAPVANFTAYLTSGTAPLTVNFTDTSTGSPTSWNWSFGDGNSSIEENPLHTYQTPGNYSVTLSITNINGTNSVTKPDFIQVISFLRGDANDDGLVDQADVLRIMRYYLMMTGTIDKQQADINNDSRVTVVDAAMLTQYNAGIRQLGGVYSIGKPYYSFTTPNDSQLTPVIELPNFSVLQGSHFDVPVIVQNVTDIIAYQVNITYNRNVLYLTGISPSNAVKNLTPGSVILSYTNSPLTPYTTTFTLTTLSFDTIGAQGDVTPIIITAQQWDSNETQVPIKIFNGYITVTAPFGPALPIPRFTASPIAGQLPLNVSFDSTISDVVVPTAYFWDFGDNVTATIVNPSHIYSEAGTYTVSLQITNASGANTTTKYNYITVNPASQPVIAQFNATPISGSAPLAVQFHDQSTGAPSFWCWTFGDGYFSNTQNPLHTYINPSSYTVRLIAGDVNLTNWNYTVKTDYITVTSAPQPLIVNFTALPTSGTAPLMVNFTDTSIGNVSTWNWSFGDGGSSSLRNPVHTYITPGNFTVILSVSNDQQSDMKVREDLIIVTEPVQPVIADFAAYPTSGVAPLTVQLTDLSSGSLISWNWSFGDGAISLEQNPAHTYTGAGNYTVTLQVSDGQQSDSKVRTNFILVTPPVQGLKAGITATPVSGTVPLTVAFTDNSTGSPNYWFWSFGDGTFSLDQNPTHTYAHTGNYTVMHGISNGQNGDMVVIDNYIQVTNVIPPVVARFEAEPRSGKAPLFVTFTDTSLHSPTMWNWSFGDGTYSSEQNPVHLYQTSGTYTVTLTVSNAAGVDSSVKSIQVKPGEKLNAKFNATPRSGDSPLIVQFYDLSEGSPTNWSWDFNSDGVIDSHDQNPVYSYVIAGNYDVTLSISTVEGNDTKEHKNYITVKPVKSAFEGAPRSGNAPLIVNFTDLSDGSPTTWAWDFNSDGIIDSFNQNPIFTYNTSGKYNVTLKASNAGSNDTKILNNYIRVK